MKTPKDLAHDTLKYFIERSIKKMIQGNAEEIFIPGYPFGIVRYRDGDHEQESLFKNICVAEGGDSIQDAFDRFVSVLDSRIKAKDFIFWRTPPELTKVNKLQYGKDFFLITAKYSIPEIEAMQ